MAGSVIGLKAKLEPELDERKADKEVRSLDDKLSDVTEAAIEGDVSGLKENLRRGVTEAILDADVPGVLKSQTAEEDILGVEESMSVLESAAATRGMEQVPGSMGRSGVDVGGEGAAAPADVGSGGILAGMSGAGGRFLKVGLAGAVGFGILKGVQKLASVSPMLGKVVEMFTTAVELFFRPFGRALGEFFEPYAKAALEMAVMFNQIASEEGLGVALVKVTEQAASSIASATMGNLGEVFSGEADLGDAIELGAVTIGAGRLMQAITFRTVGAGTLMTAINFNAVGAAVLVGAMTFRAIRADDIVGAISWGGVGGPLVLSILFGATTITGGMVIGALFGAVSIKVGDVLAAAFPNVDTDEGDILGFIFAGLTITAAAVLAVIFGGLAMTPLLILGAIFGGVVVTGAAIIDYIFEDVTITREDVLDALFPSGMGMSEEERDSANEQVQEDTEGTILGGDPPGAQTGGYVEREGAAILHRGERVVPASQVTDRGEVEISEESRRPQATGRTPDNGVDDVVNALQDILRELERMEVDGDVVLDDSKVGRKVRKSRQQYGSSRMVTR